VLSLLDSRHVAGLRVFRGQEIGPGAWPGIIDVGMFREVQERRAYRAAQLRAAYPLRGSGGGRFYLLRSLVWCTACGIRMSGVPNNGRPTYMCTSPRSGKTCNRRINAAILEPFAADAAARMLEGLDLSGHRGADVLTADEVDTIQADQEQLAEAAGMWANGEITKAEYLAMRATIQKRIKDAQRKSVVRPAIEVLEGMTGPGARQAWEKLENAGDCERLNALLRFPCAAIRIDRSVNLGGRVDYGRIDIEPNPVD
jgi:hypothetical protein